MAEQNPPQVQAPTNIFTPRPVQIMSPTVGGVVRAVRESQSPAAGSPAANQGPIPPQTNSGPLPPDMAPGSRLPGRNGSTGRSAVGGGNRYYGDDRPYTSDELPDIIRRPIIGTAPRPGGPTPAPTPPPPSTPTPVPDPPGQVGPINPSPGGNAAPVPSTPRVPTPVPETPPRAELINPRPGGNASPIGPATPPPAAATPTTQTPSWTGQPPTPLRDWREGFNEVDRDAVTREVGENELTSRQLARLIDENGRYIQGARLNADERSATSGMLMSSFAMGAAERAAIDAGVPIAQADAGVYANTASENMRARNEDIQADQNQGRSLFGQSLGLEAQMAEAEQGRRFQSTEAAGERNWRSGESGLDRAQQTFLQQMQQDFQGTQAEYERAERRWLQGDQQAFQRGEAEIERDWRDEVQVRDQTFTGEQNELSREQQRFSEYSAIMRSREEQLSQQLAAIFSNPKLSAKQQEAAAANARALFTSVTASFNAAFAAGIPEIFKTPYQMPPSTPPTNPPGGG